MKILLGFMWLLHFLPLPILGRFGEAIGSLMFLILGKRRKIALTNLRLCLPELDERARRTIAQQHFRAYARSIFERSILWWAPEERVRSLIQIEPSVPLAAMQDGPTILLCPHFVCLDVAGVASRVIPVCSRSEKSGTSSLRVRLVNTWISGRGSHSSPTRGLNPS